ncbi:MAG: nucleotidyltransferase family protein [Reyranellaceae bacterium]
MDGRALWRAVIRSTMPSIDVVLELRKRADEIRQLGATSLYVFGSMARGEAAADSDVDLFVDYDPARFSFVELVRLRERLSEVLGRPADPTTREGLHQMLRPTIEAEAIKVF